jgi:hypothetical protein
LFALENDVMKDLTDFNKKYRLYLTCASTGNENQEYIDKKICPTNTDNLRTDLENAYKKLTAPGGSLVKLQDAIKYLPSTSNGIDQSQYLANYYAILNQYREVVGKRQDLDSKLAEKIVKKAGLIPLESYSGNNLRWKCKCLK